MLQNRLVDALRDQAIQREDQLPPQLRDRFVDGFTGAAKDGLHISAAQRSTGAQFPQQLAGEVFQNGFVDAMHPTLVFPIVLVVLAALSCLAVKRRKHKARPEEQLETTAAYR